MSSSLRDEVADIVKETLLNIEGIEEECRAVKRRLQEHLDSISTHSEDTV